MEKQPYSMEYEEQSTSGVPDHMPSGNLPDNSLEKAKAPTYMCDICLKEVSRKDSLARHLKTHENKMSYFCEECPKRFKRKDSLIRHHKKTHAKSTSNESNIECFDVSFNKLLLDKATGTQDRRKYEPKIGECYIFNYQDFYVGAPRPGSEKDVERLKYNFNELNFDVHSDYNDLTKEETLDALKNAAESGKKEDKCFICCFLSHGNLGKLKTKNGFLEINDILRRFSHSNCENLKGVPKIFIFQACRGTCGEDGIPCNTERAVCATNEYDSISELTDIVDFLLVYSTYDGKYSYRYKEQGTFFINELCRTFEDFSDKLDLLQILTIVNYRLAHYFVNKEDMKKQMPYFTSYLRTKIDFEKNINPLVTEHTKFFDKLRSDSCPVFQNTDKESDKKTYRIQGSKKIKFLMLLNMNNYFGPCLLDCTSALWRSVTKMNYQIETFSNFTERELMYILEKVASLDVSNTDCLICFIVCHAIEDHLCDSDGKHFQKQKIIEMFAGKFVGKPKIFIFLMLSLIKREISTDSTNGGDDHLIPVHSDLLEVIVTVQDSDQLKAVIEKFTVIFGNESSEDFLSQLTRVNEELVNNQGFHSDPEQNLAKNLFQLQSNSGQNAATFHFHSTLTETLILNMPSTENHKNLEAVSVYEFAQNMNGII